jgi:hypothetical protein
VSQGTKTDTPLQSTPIGRGAINSCTPYAQSAGSKNSCSLSQLREPAEPSAPVAGMNGGKLKAYPSCLS